MNDDVNLPDPAFKLRWHDDTARYTVSVPNIGDTDCYTADQVRAAVEADRQGRMPSDEELKAFGEEEQFFLFCSEEEFLDIAKTVLRHYRYSSGQPVVSGKPVGYALIEGGKAVAFFNEIPADGHYDASAYVPLGVVGAPAQPPASISRDLLGRIVDECFDGAIEDSSVIEDIYRVIVREYGQPVSFGRGETRMDAGSSARNEGDSGRPAASADPVAHTDDDAVDQFAAAMKAKLAQARAKGRHGWQECDPSDLSQMLRAHVEKGDPRDVANFCCFLWSLGKPISTAPVAQEPVQGEKFLRAWVNLDEFPGGMMVGPGGRFGPVPGSTSCWITTSEREAERMRAEGPVTEVWAHSAPVAAQAQPQQSENQEALADTQRAIIEAAERRGYERAIAECAQVARAAKERA